MEQHPQEFEWMLGFVAGARSILEIGSRGGASLKGLAAVLASNARIRCIDIVSSEELLATIAELRSRGFDAEALFADSQGPRAFEWARRAGPYDFVFIDGDHDDPGVTQDWKCYGMLGKVVALHDIASPPHDVRTLWSAIKAAGYSTHELVIEGAHMGVGVVRHDG